MCEKGLYRTPQAINAGLLLAVFPLLHGKNDDDIAEDDRKPAANQQEEMLTTEVQAQFIQRTIPSLPAIAGNVVAWICEFCDSQWPQSQKMW